MMILVHVDCEGHGYSPFMPVAGLNNHEKFEFGAVEHETGESFHGVGGTKETFLLFASWLASWQKDGDRVVFVSDNPAYDFQFINFYFWKFLGHNPFGWSARRIGDFASGLQDSFYASQDWKKLRRTKHDHNPVHDAMGNREALVTLMEIAANRNKCWEWPSPDKDGYGRISVKHRSGRMHRAVWEAVNGPIPDGMQVLHRCDNPPCFNPKHLFLGTAADNVRDMDAKGRRNTARTFKGQLKTHCKQGHAFTEENIYWHNRKRHCQSCKDATNRKWSAVRSTLLAERRASANPHFIIPTSNDA